VAIALQSLFDEGPENDLKAHRQLESDRCLAGDDAGPVQDVSREDEKNSGPIFEHDRPLPSTDSPEQLESYLRPGCQLTFLI